MRHGRIWAGGLIGNASQEMSECTVWRIIHLKRLADRPRDREDIEKLEEILRLKGERGDGRG